PGRTTADNGTCVRCIAVQREVGSNTRVYAARRYRETQIGIADVLQCDRLGAVATGRASQSAGKGQTWRVPVIFFQNPVISGICNIDVSSLIYRDSPRLIHSIRGDRGLDVS